MAMSVVVTMVLHHFTKLLAYDLLVMFLLFSHLCSSYHMAAPPLLVDTQFLYRRFLGDSSLFPPPDDSGFSPPSPQSDALLPQPGSTYTSSYSYSKTSEVDIAVSVPPVVIVVVCLAGFLGWFLYRRRKAQTKSTKNDTPRSDAHLHDGAGAVYGSNRSDDSDGDPVSQGFSRKLPKRYSFHTLAMATSEFNEQLGKGGFGPVFKGFLDEIRTDVAVKRVSKEANGAPKQYEAEVKILTRLCHRNLVELLGWCEKEGEFLLVYKYMPNGSLNSQLYSMSRLLTWRERYNIVLGLASSLNYLHEECEDCILHRDIKPDNVLLDSAFNTKLSDFGLARLVGHDIGLTNTTLAGTRPYMAPESFQEGTASKESDIYSFGVVLLEIACGRAPWVRDHPKLIDLVWDHYGRKEILKLADKRLISGGDNINYKQMECVMIVGLWCAHPDYSERPTIGDAIRVLNFKAPLPELVPPSRPLHLLSRVESSPKNYASAGSSGYT